jgi:hypothetical protein
LVLCIPKSAWLDQLEEHSHPEHSVEVEQCGQTPEHLVRAVMLKKKHALLFDGNTLPNDLLNLYFPKELVF